MNKEEKIQKEVDEIVASIRARGWKLSKTPRRALEEASALGIAPYLGAYARPDVKGAEIVAAVIAAATDAGGKKQTVGGWSVGGDADVTSFIEAPSALYLALNS